MAGSSTGNQVHFMLPLLGRMAVLGSWVVADAAQGDGPHPPEPPGVRAGVAALRLYTAVSCVTDVLWL